MKSFKFILTVFCIANLFFAACKKDNYEAPSSKLTGRLLSDGQAVGLRTNRVQLELWQHGYDFFGKIRVFVNQDGSYSALLFDGDYKMTVLRGFGPWPDRTDSIDVKVRGNTIVDVPVSPYFVVSNSSFQKNGNTISGTVTIKKGTSTGSLESVSLFINKSVLTDDVYKVDGVSIPAANITNVNQPIPVSINIPASLTNEEAVYVRAGVKASGALDMAFGEPIKISLK